MIGTEDAVAKRVDAAGVHRAGRPRRHYLGEHRRVAVIGGVAGDEDIVVGVAHDAIGANAADEQVASGAADDQVVAVVAKEDVVTGAALD